MDRQKMLDLSSQFKSANNLVKQVGGRPVTMQEGDDID